ncbi:triosephosphate isomerase [Enterococcus malodoratus]|uniref:triose-phosphate isomerase family protein n=1 Tax=Enterococcus malodoratus TaxID=71451 RepID=UPI0008AF21D4|nr:triose-phosphate isomerase [Enterococcus malodoratus]SET54709.1 triosephosphate isomerase [Enterococcus malodoratus]
MSIRKPVVAMSWAMRQNKKIDAVNFASEIIKELNNDTEIEKIIFPSIGTLPFVSEVTKDTTVLLGAQNIAPYKHGQYTGEYSIESLIDIGGKYVEIGHWERRELFGDTDEIINKKVRLSLENGLIPILCVGEKDKTDDYHEIELQLRRQLYIDTLDIAASDINKIIIAYTPKWVVGKTLAASAPQVHKVGEMIRKIIADFFNDEAAQNVRIIYGGSVSPENTRLLVKDENIDGVLIGRFGSDPKRFAQVVQVIEEIKENAD